MSTINNLVVAQEGVCILKECVIINAAEKLLLWIIIS